MWFAAVIVLLFSSISVFGKDFMVVSRVGYSRSFISPQTLTDYISQTNAAAKNSGFEGFFLPAIREVESASIYFGFLFRNEFDAGLELILPGRATSKTSAKDPGGKTYTQSLELLSTGLSVRANYSFVIFESFRLYTGPAVGMKWYFLEVDSKGDSYTDSSLMAKNDSLYYRLTFGVDTILSKNFGVFLEGGYERSRSGPLTVTKAENVSGASVGTKLNMTEQGGSDLDLSGSYINLGMSLWI